MKIGKITRSCLAAIAIAAVLVATAAVLVATAAPALAREDTYTGSTYTWSKGPRGDAGRMVPAGHEMKNVYMTLAMDGMAGDMARFSVPGMTAKGMEDKAVLIAPGAPLGGTYNTTNDMGYISTASFMPATMTIDQDNRITLPVAGASAVMGMHDIKVLAKDKGYMVFQFGEVSFFMPGGSAATYRLDQPVRVTYAEDRKMVVIDGYPSFTKLMADMLGAGDKFPADAAPVPLTSLMTAKSAAVEQTVPYKKPAYVPPPG